MSKSLTSQVASLDDQIGSRIYLIRGHRVMLDADLAFLYGVKTKVLIQAVKRNNERFPRDFMFQLTSEDIAILRSQFVTSSWGGRRYLPYAFTEQGVAMLSSVLKSRQAALVNIAIMRAFVKVREVLATHKDWLQRLDAIERKLTSHDTLHQQHAEEIRAVFHAIRQLMAPSPKRSRHIGFKA
ncbi:MAG: ORF6N domain-containing protein [Elusimicrobia bacterium]|nr:ORF6N domain-containing protein [Elusimicrobiota bacterium]